MTLPDKTHPVWRVGSQAILLLTVLALNASEFDKTEMLSVVMWLFGASGIEAVLRKGGGADAL